MIKIFCVLCIAGIVAIASAQDIYGGRYTSARQKKNAKRYGSMRGGLQSKDQKQDDRHGGTSSGKSRLGFSAAPKLQGHAPLSGSSSRQGNPFLGQGYFRERYRSSAVSKLALQIRTQALAGYQKPLSGLDIAMSDANKKSMLAHIMPRATGTRKQKIRVELADKRSKANRALQTLASKKADAAALKQQALKKSTVGVVPAPGLNRPGLNGTPDTPAQSGGQSIYHGFGSAGSPYKTSQTPPGTGSGQGPTGGHSRGGPTGS